MGKVLFENVTNCEVSCEKRNLINDQWGEEGLQTMWSLVTVKIIALDITSKQNLIANEIKNKITPVLKVLNQGVHL